MLFAELPSDAGALRHAAHWCEVETPVSIPERGAPAVECAVAQAEAAQSNAPVAGAPVLTAPRVSVAVQRAVAVVVVQDEFPA